MRIPPHPHLTHYSTACVKRVIAQITHRQLSVRDTGDHNHPHKQPLIALSGSSNIVQCPAPSWARAAGPNALGTVALQPGPNFTLMNLDLARLLRERQPRPSNTLLDDLKRLPWPPFMPASPVPCGNGAGGSRRLFLSLAQASIPAHTHREEGPIARSPTHARSQPKGDKSIFTGKSSHADSGCRQ